jgi:hypothetical protein
MELNMTYRKALLLASAAVLAATFSASPSMAQSQKNSPEGINTGKSTPAAPTYINPRLQQQGENRSGDTSSAGQGTDGSGPGSTAGAGTGTDGSGPGSAGGAAGAAGGAAGGTGSGAGGAGAGAGGAGGAGGGGAGGGSQ